MNESDTQEHEAKGSRATALERWQYHFDRQMAHGTVRLLLWLTAASGALIAVIAAVLALGFVSTADRPEHAHHYGESVWTTIGVVLDPGTSSESGWLYRVLMLVAAIFGILIVSTIIGVLTTGIEQKLTSLRRGRSRIVEHNHTIILGWSNKVVDAIEQLVIANKEIAEHERAEKRPVIAVLADRDVVEMKEDVDSHIPERHNTDIIFRRGDPCDLGSIRLVRPEYARSAILFAEEKQRGDAVVLKRLLAARRSDVHRKSPLRIVAEVDNRQNSEAILGMNAGACVVDSSSFVTSILLQAAREPGLGLVYEEFTDFDGWEIYFDDLDSIASPPASQTYGDAVLDPHRPCSVFGIAPKNGPHILNPPAEHLLAEGDRLVVLAEDGAESRRSLSPPIATRTTENKPEQAIVNQDQVPPREPMHCIILGWHRWASALLEEFDAALPQGSTVHIVCDASLTAHRGGPPLSLLNSLNNLRITTEEADTCERTTIENLGSNLSRADRIILLCYRDTLSSQEADSCTLLTLLHVRNQLQGSNSHHPIIAELLDAKTRELAQSDHDNDFIASDRIISSVMTQFSENPELPPILEELLTTNGSEVHLRPRSAFFRDATNAPFKAVIREGLSRCETVIGVLRFRSGSQPAVDWNIHDSNFMALGENDKVIVIAED